MQKKANDLNETTTIKCPNCNNDVDTTADRCGNCGTEMVAKKGAGKGTLALVIVLVAALVAVMLLRDT